MQPPEDRPRERLVRLGPRALLDAELIELLIGAGTKGAPASVVAAALLAESGTLAALATWDTHDFGRVHGLGPAKAAELAKESLKTGESIRELVTRLKVLPDDELKRVLDLRAMTEIGVPGL